MKLIQKIAFSLFMGISIQVFTQNLPENLGNAVNSEYLELNPVIAPDGQTLYFGRKSHPENKFGVTGSEQASGSQDIWFSELSNGTWSQARRMSETLNREQYNTILSITPDGQKMLLKGSYENGVYTGRGFSLARKKGNGWEIPQKIDIPKYSKYSKGLNDFGFLSADGKVLLMAFATKKNSEDDDLYASFLERDETWSAPIFLGEDLNTNFQETTPFLAADGKTLYFSSNREGGMGKNDIYVSKRKDKTWVNWTKPENVGTPINSEDYDAYYTQAASGDYAYFLSGKNSLGKKDIFRIKLEPVQPKEPVLAKKDGGGQVGSSQTESNQNPTKIDPVVLISGKVINPKTGTPPADARVAYEDLITGEELGSAFPDPISGLYKIVLPYGRNYGISVKAEGYVGNSINIDLSKLNGKYLEIEGKDLNINPIERGVKVTMNNIFFEFGKAALKPESFAELNRIVAFLKENYKTVIEIGGHTDNVGSDEINNKLSQERADVVRNYLLSIGMKAERVTAKGYGKTQPKVSNDTPEGQAINRRVEFSILRN